jgi:diaminohydroxyphosphoribosylaminopyrimidine deaminase / 5-amino-6-(5-phosphoribosylamino)uracil reductase
MATPAEREAMGRAVVASTAALGAPNPNPCVGAVVLDRDGAVAGEGVTSPVGGPHAEINALQAAGARAVGGTVVVTLEPCRHTGRTGACTAAILAAGVRRVVYALPDPLATAGGGAEELRRAGLEVEEGVLAEEAAAVLGPWRAGAGGVRPHLTWKYAATLDGRTAAADGTSQWITGTAARRDVHRERFASDAVIVGIGTVLADDPQLTVRDWPASRQPLRVVVDSDARTPLDARVLDASAATLVATAAGADPGRRDGLRQAGTEVVELPRHAGQVDLVALCTLLRQREVFVAVLEGGATLAASFVVAGLVDRVLAYLAPSLLGAGSPAVGDLGIKTLADAVQLRVDEVTLCGSDVRVAAHLAVGSD